MIRRRISRSSTHSHSLKRALILRIVLVWTIALLSLTGTLLWVQMENQRIMALYHQSPVCSTQAQVETLENCQVYQNGTVVKVSFVYSLVMPNRHGGSPNAMQKVVAADVEIIFPDKSAGMFRIHTDPLFQMRADHKQDDFVWAYLEWIKDLKKGDVLTLCHYHGKIITMEFKSSSPLLTLEHPENVVRARNSTASGIAVLLIIALFAWTGYELLRKPG